MIFDWRHWIKGGGLWLAALSAVLLSASILLTVFLVDMSFPLERIFRSIDLAADQVETVRGQQYLEGGSAVALGDIANQDKAHFHLTLRFLVNDDAGYQNVFQTAPFNRGTRMEIAGSSAAVIFADSGEKAGFLAFKFSNTIEKGRWYSLDVEVRNHAFLHVELDGSRVASYSSPTISIETSEFLVGTGFDASRSFHGRIEDIKLIKSIPFELRHLGLVTCVTLLIMLALTLVLALFANAVRGTERKVIGAFALVLMVTMPAGAYLLHPSFWVDEAIALTGATEDNSETIHIERFSSDRDKPLPLGSIKNPLNAYFRLILRFRAADDRGYPNLFQTAPYNRGVRMEFAGTDAVLLMADTEVAGGVRGITLTKNLEMGRWYKLEIEALNGNFIRGTLDGQPVALEAGANLQFEMSQFVVGGGFDGARAFHGDIEQISLIKRNPLPLPHQGLLAGYVMLGVLFFLFLLSLYLTLGVSIEIQSVVGRLVLLAFPLIPLLIYHEYHLAFVNTNYYVKRVEFERKRNKIEILVGGSSNAFYGVKTEVFDRPGFNLAFPGHSMYLDARLIEKNVRDLPRLRMIILTVNYYTMGTDDTKSQQSWRQLFVRQNFDVPIEKTRNWPFDWEFFGDPRNFSRIALYGKEARNYATVNYRAPVDVIASESGWYDAGDVGADPALDLGAATALKHGAVGIENYDLNLGYWERLLPELKRRNIDVAIVMLPTDVSYYSKLDPLKNDVLERKLLEFAQRHNVRFINYTKDPRFSPADFTWELVDHLNGKGAAKFSKMLNDEVIELRSRGR
jgi:hypothetical protein